VGFWLHLPLEHSHERQAVVVPQSVDVVHSGGAPPAPLAALVLEDDEEDELLPAPPAPPPPLAEDELVAPLCPPEVLPELPQPWHDAKPVPSARHV
jgi:hypothetical protein